MLFIKKMSFLNISDPAKRDFIFEEFLNTKRNIQQNLLAEKLGDIGLQRKLTKLYTTELQSAQTVMLMMVLQALPASQLKVVTFPNYPSIKAETDDVSAAESLLKIGPTAAHYLRSMVSKTTMDKTFGLYDRD